MSNSLLVFLGGGLGSLARYALHLSLGRMGGPSWLHSTFVVNVIGSFLMGALVATQMSTTGRLALTTGFLGGFTTYSALNQELLELIRQGLWYQAATYLLALLSMSLISASVGAWLALSVGRT